MSWNNRIFKRDYYGKTLYEIHEVFYNDDGNICTWTDEPEFGPAETIDELIDWIKMIYEDAVKYREDLLDYDSTPQDKWDFDRIKADTCNPEEDDETHSD